MSERNFTWRESRLSNLGFSYCSPLYLHVAFYVYVVKWFGMVIDAFNWDNASGTLSTLGAQQMNLHSRTYMALVDHLGIAFIHCVNFIKSYNGFTDSHWFCASPEMSKPMSILLPRPYSMLIGMKGQRARDRSMFIFYKFSSFT